MSSIVEMLIDKIKALLLAEEDHINIQHTVMPVEENSHHNNGKYKEAPTYNTKLSLTIADSIIDKLYATEKHKAIRGHEPGCSSHHHDIVMPYPNKILPQDTVPAKLSISRIMNKITSVNSVHSTFRRSSRRKPKGSAEYVPRMETIFENKPFPLYHSNVASSDVESSGSTEMMAHGVNYSEMVDHSNIPPTSPNRTFHCLSANHQLIADFDNGITGQHEVVSTNSSALQTNKKQTSKHLYVNKSLKVHKVTQLSGSENISFKSNVPLQSLQTTSTLLENYTCEENEFFSNPLYWAACRGDIKDVLFYSQSRSMVHYKDHEGRTPLHMGVLDGNLEIISTLLRTGADPNSEDGFGFTPLHYAVLRRGSIKIAQILFDAGAFIPQKRSPMSPGLFLGYCSSTDLVIIAKPTEDELQLFHLLLQHGALIDDPSAPGGRQALHYAAMSNNATLTAVLLDLGADVNALNCHGMTPRQVAAFYGCGEVVFTIDEIGLARITTDSPLSAHSSYA